MTIAAKDILVGDEQAYLVECVARSAAHYFVVVEVIGPVTQDFPGTSTWRPSGEFALLAQDRVPPVQAAYLGMLKRTRKRTLSPPRDRAKAGESARMGLFEPSRCQQRLPARDGAIRIIV